MKEKSLRELYPDAILINNWSELEKHKDDSKTHYLDLYYTEFKGKIMPYNGVIERKGGKGDEFYFLTTHAFCGKGCYRESTHNLQRCGFNVIIKNRDGETW